MADPKEDSPPKPPSRAVMTGVAVMGVLGVLVSWFVMSPTSSGSAAPGGAPPGQPLAVAAAPKPNTAGAVMGQKAPDFRLPQVGGANIRLSALRGKEIVLIFYRTHT